MPSTKLRLHQDYGEKDLHSNIPFGKINASSYSDPPRAGSLQSAEGKKFHSLFRGFLLVQIPLLLHLIHNREQPFSSLVP